MNSRTKICLSEQCDGALAHVKNDLSLLPLIREGQDGQSSQPLLMNTSIVSPEYFHLLGMTLLRGRLFVDQDLEDTPSIAVICSPLQASPLYLPVSRSPPVIFRRCARCASIQSRPSTPNNVVGVA